jgi:hypothetical protein
MGCVIAFKLSTDSENNHTDTVVRYTTDVRTGGRFFTDNPSGALRERKGVPDAPLASNFFPCSTSLLLKGEQRTPLVVGFAFNQVCFKYRIFT